MEEGDSDPKTRTLDVTLQGGAPWGFSVKGGSEHRCPLTIARIEAGGKASQSGVLQVDDIILSINNVECEAHTEAIQLVKGSPDTLHLVIQRSGSDLHLRKTMKQTEYCKPSLQDISPKEVKSPHIYDVAPSPPPQTYEKSGHIYDIKKSPDYDVPPSSKAATSGVSRRLRRGESGNQTRPKSWHNDEASQTWEEPAFKKSPKPVAQQPLPRPAPQLPSHQQTQRIDPSPSMESLTVLQTFHKRPMPHSNTQSMSNLQGLKDKTARSTGFVNRRVSDYISSSNRELSSRDKDIYFVSGEKRGGPLIPFNPKFRDVELQPAETYPKVVMATQLQSAKQQAFIGVVPDAQTLQSQPQTYSTSQVVSYSTVQMPQRHYASTIELGGKYWDEGTKSHQQMSDQLVSPMSGHPVYRATPRMSPSPTPSEKREPPTPPQRGDSRNRTHQISEHNKYPSWPVRTADTQDSRRKDNNCTPSSVISPTEIPPVKLSSKQEQLTSNHSKTYSMKGEPAPLYTYGGEPLPNVQSCSSSSSVSQLQGNRETVGSETFPGMNKNNKEMQYLYTALPFFIDPESPATDTKSFFPCSTPQNVPKQKPSSEYQPRGSPPTRDNVDRITEEKDPLVMAFQSFMQTAVDHEEQLQGVNPDGSSTGSESPVHHPRSTAYSDYSKSHSQPLSTYMAQNEDERRLSRTSVSSLDSHTSSSQRVKSPTSRLSSDEEEQNRKNSQHRKANQRTRKSPDDFSSKKAAMDSEKQWQKFVTTADPTWGEKYPQPDDSSDPKSEVHVRVSSIKIDEKHICGNAPGVRSPISPLMEEAVTTIEAPNSELIMESQHKEIKFLKVEGRDSGYEVDADNQFRAQQESPNYVQNVGDTFSSDDRMKLDKVESTGGTSILSQLQKETPYSQRYTNGEPILKSTVNRETKVEIKIYRPNSNSESNRQQHTRPDTSTAQSWNTRPQPLCPPKSKDELLQEMNGSKDARNAYFGSQPQLSRQSRNGASSRHYHSSSLDLDTKATGPHLITQSNFPPWKPEVGDESNSSVSHSKSYSCSGLLYQSYPGLSEPRFSRIDEEQGNETAESGPGSRSSNRLERRSASGSFSRPHELYKSDVKEHRPSTSESKSGDQPILKISESRGKYSRGESDSMSQHQYSKSDSEQHRKSSTSDQWHTNSDPSGAISKSHRVSDPRLTKEALINFVQMKRGLSRSDGSVFGSQQGSLSDSQYSSMTSLPGKRGGGIGSLDHSRSSSVSSQVSHAHRDSGIVSPSESSWFPLPPNTSPPSAMDHRQHGLQKASDNYHQRAASDTNLPVKKVRDTSSLPRSSYSLSEDYPPTKKPIKMNRSASMTHPSRRRPVSYHDHRDGQRSRDDFVKSLSLRQTPHSSATLPVSGYHNYSAWNQPSPEHKKDSDEPPKQVKEAQLKTIAKVEPIHLEEDNPYRTGDAERQRKISGPAETVFNFPLPTRVEQYRYSSPKTSPTLPSKEASPTAQVTSRLRTKTSPTLPGSKETSPSYQGPRTRTSSTLPAGKETTSSPTHQVITRSRTSPTLSASKEKSPARQAVTRTRTSPTLSTSKEGSPTHLVQEVPRTRAESFDLPPPPTPPAVPITELGGELPPPPPEVLGNYTISQREDKRVVEELISTRRVASTQASVSRPQASFGNTSHSISPPRTSNSSSPDSTEDRSPVFATLDNDPEVKLRFETPKSDPIVPAAKEVVVDSSGSDVPDGSDRSETPSSVSRFSPIFRRPALDLELDDEAKPIEVVEIIHTPTLSPKRGERVFPGNDADEEEHSQDPIVDWVLHSLNSQDFSLRELFQFPEEPLELGSLRYKKMPHEKKEEAAQSPKRSECDVKSLTHALSSSMYLQISPAKALLLTRAKSMMGSDVVQGDSEEIRKTKEDLISRITRKVLDLRKEKDELQNEISNIEELGKQVTENVRKSCKANSLDKYLMYVGDADRVTKLLLSLSRRLAKVNSVLNSLEGIDEEEQKPDLQRMYKDLTGKYEDAKGLKVSIDARHVQISTMLQDHLSQSEYEDFRYFVPMRSRLRIMSQELDDRITLGEEQLQALRDSIKEERSLVEGEGSQSGADSS